VIALFLARQRFGRGPLAAALYFGGTLVPAMGFFAVYPFQFSLVADHFQYLASIGVIALAASLLVTVLRYAPAAAHGIIPALLLAILGGLTWRQGHIYKDAVSLWNDTLSKNPGAWIAHNNLSAHFHSTGEFERARHHALSALALKDDYPGSHINLGVALEEMAHASTKPEPQQLLLHQAAGEYRRAIALEPRYMQAHLNLAKVLWQQGDVAGAENHYRQAIALTPGYAPAHYNWSVFLAGQQRLSEADAACRIALSLEPTDADAHALLGVLLYQQGRPNEAANELREALRLNPEHHQASQWLQQLAR
jgi:tetratricopeptide (TPR) repeat protein